MSGYYTFIPLTLNSKTEGGNTATKQKQLGRPTAAKRSYFKRINCRG